MSAPANPLEKSSLADLLTLKAVHEWTIANQPQRALAELAKVKRELARRQELKLSEVNTNEP